MPKPGAALAWAEPAWAEQVQRSAQRRLSERSVQPWAPRLAPAVALELALARPVRPRVCRRPLDL